MDEKFEIPSLSDYTVSVRVGNDVKYLTMDILAAISDKFLYEELCDTVAQSPFSLIVYSGVRNKTRFTIYISPKNV